MPVGQAVQENEPGFEYELPSQAVHELWPLPLKVPAGQNVHCDAPAAEYVPAEHAVQGWLPFGPYVPAVQAAVPQPLTTV